MKTIEEVQEYFKNAQTVRCLYDGSVFNFNEISKNGIHKYATDFYVQDKNGIDYLLYSSHKNQLAEIITYKSEKKIIKNDAIVSSVMFQLAQRSIVGQQKYGTTLQENNTDDFLQHLKEELLDAVLYIEKLQQNGKNI